MDFAMPATGRRSLKRTRREDTGRGDDMADFAFNNFEFVADAGKRQKIGVNKSKKVRTMDMLSRVQQVRERVNSLRGTQEGMDLNEDVQWQAALDRAAGKKVKDDPDKLKKTLKRAKKMKEKSREKWAKFKEAVTKAKEEGRAIPKRLSKPKDAKKKTRTRTRKEKTGDDAEGGGKGKGGKGGKGSGKGGKGAKGSKGGKGGKGSSGKGGKRTADDAGMGEGGKGQKAKDRSKLGKITRRLDNLKGQHNQKKAQAKAAKKGKN